MSMINVIGAACVDLLCTGLDREKFFSGKFKMRNITTYFGGDALNEALVLKAMDKDVRLISILGDDLYGNYIAAELWKKGIAFDDKNIRKDMDTAVSLVFIEEDGERFFVGNEDGSLRLLDTADIQVDEDCRIVSFASLFISKKMDAGKYEQLFTEIKGNGITLCVDTSTPKNNEKVEDCRFLRYIDYLFINESEAKALCHSSNLWECEKLLYAEGVKNVLIKCGKNGCLYQGQFYRPEKEIRSIDSTGAGDSFAAGFISRLSERKDIEECISFANYCGGLCCQRIGASAWLQDYRKESDNKLQ